MIKKIKKWLDLLEKNTRLRKFVIGAICIVVALLVVVSTFVLHQVESAKGLNITVSSEPSTLDPTFFVGSENGTLIVNLFEGLMKTDENGVLKTAQASSYSVSDDGKTYTFTISDKAKWSNGSPVTAKDFVYAWRRTANPDNNTEYSYMFKVIAGYDKILSQFEKDGTYNMSDLAVTATDSRTLKVRLKEKDSSFLNKCAFPAFFPLCEELVPQNTRIWSTNIELFVGNGAYVLSQWSIGNYLVMKRNENYINRDSVNLEMIKVYFISDENEAVSKFNSGKILYTASIPDDRAKKLSKQKEFNINDKYGTYFISFNLGVKPFDDIKVREALTLAVDRNEIVSELIGSKGIEANALIGNAFNDKDTNNTFRSAGRIYFDVDKSSLDANIEKAKQLLKEAGYENGKGFPKFKYLYNDNTFSKAVAEKVAEMWKNNLGIECSIKSESWSRFSSDKAGENYSVAKDGILCAYDSPSELLCSFESSLNHCGWKNSSYDSTVNKIRVSSGDSLISLCHDAENILMDNWVICPLFFYAEPYLASKRLADFYVLGEGFAYFANARIKMF